MEGLYLIARIAGQMVAIDSDQVESVIDLSDVTPIPLAPDHVVGISAIRSRVVTVIDSCAALGRAPAEATGRAIIVGLEGHYYAVLVEDVEDVLPFIATPLPDGIVLDPQWRELGRGFVDRDGEPLLIIDPTGIVSACPSEP
ncbi:purine-binding chemotaxis protein CheW [Stakelama pacifica]|uniref:Purine-binding chemotaxis protein CheW n=2 Tax=Stakelama pacifica TaxID=517720 RepID=A0A4R6FGL7_9SPHN|nr:purine-binding chemotaxis protein CheW [Stakelama pacifica]